MKRFNLLLMSILMATVSFAQEQLNPVLDIPIGKNSLDSFTDYIMPNLTNGKAYIFSCGNDEITNIKLYSLPDFTLTKEINTRENFEFVQIYDYEDFDSGTSGGPGISFCGFYHKYFIATNTLFNSDDTWEWIEMSSDESEIDIVSDNGVLARIKRECGEWMELEHVFKYNNKVYLIIDNYGRDESDNYIHEDFVYEYNPETTVISKVCQNNLKLNKVKKVLKCNAVNIESPNGTFSVDGKIRK